MMEVGMLNIVKHRAMTMENWVCFTYHNILECVTMLDENKMKKKLDSSLVEVLMHIIQTSQIYLMWLVMWFCFVTSKWIIKHWSPYENAWSLRIWWIFKHHSYIFWALFVGSKIHGVRREEIFNHFNKEDVEAYFNYSSLQEFSWNWIGAQCFVKGKLDTR